MFFVCPNAIQLIRDMDDVLNKEVAVVQWQIAGLPCEWGINEICKPPGSVASANALA